MIRCEMCGREGRWQAHHPTGKDCLRHHPGGEGCDCFLDPNLTVPLCHDHHTLCHDDWYTLGVAQPEGDLTWAERVELRLRRLAEALGRIDQTRGGESLFGKLASALVRWADELRRFIRKLDDYAPGWREDQGFYPSGPMPIAEG